MSELLKVGDLVKLKSGGPLMAVSQVHDLSSRMGPTRGRVVCTWFDVRDHAQQGEWSELVLDSAKDLGEITESMLVAEQRKLIAAQKSYIADLEARRT